MRRRKGEEASSREQVKGLTPAALSAETNEEEKVATNGFSAPTVSELQSSYKTSARLSERQRGNLLSSSNQSTAEHELSPLTCSVALRRRFHGSHGCELMQASDLAQHRRGENLTTLIICHNSQTISQSTDAFKFKGSFSFLSEKI